MNEIEQYIEHVAADGALTPEERKALLGLLTKDKVKDRVRDGVLMRADYTKKTQELAEERKKVQADHERLLGWEKEARDKIEKLNKALEEKSISAAQYEARLKRIGDDYGIDLSDLNLSNSQPATEPTTKTPAMDPGFLEDFQKLKQGFETAGQAWPEVAAELYDLGNEHQELFGKPLKNGRDLVKTAIKEKITLREAWEREHKVPERRTEILRETIRKEEKDRLEAEFRQRASEIALGPGQKPAGEAGPESPVLSRKFKPQFSEAGEGQKEPPAPGGRTDAERETGGGAVRATQLYMQRRMSGVPLGKEAT